MITCKHCGTSSEDGTYFCEKCGKLLVTAGPVPAHQSVEQTPAPPAGVSACPKCGAAVPAGSLFCQACGASLSGVRPSPPETRRDAASPLRQASPLLPGAKILECGNVQSVAPTMLEKLTSGLRNGKLILYTDRIEFVPGSLNVFGHGKAVIPITDVASVDFCAVLMMPLGVEIKTRGGAAHTYMFPVTSKDDKDIFVKKTREVLAANGGI
jgi:uncharacterized Zn finger protein (UPF0148 family)